MDTVDRSHSTAPSRKPTLSIRARRDSGAAGGGAADARPRAPARTDPSGTHRRRLPPRCSNWRAAAPTCSARSSSPHEGHAASDGARLCRHDRNRYHLQFLSVRSRRRDAVGQRHVDRRCRRQDQVFNCSKRSRGRSVRSAAGPHRAGNARLRGQQLCARPPDASTDLCRRLSDASHRCQRPRGGDDLDRSALGEYLNRLARASQRIERVADRQHGHGDRRRPQHVGMDRQAHRRDRVLQTPRPRRRGHRPRRGSRRRPPHLRFRARAVERCTSCGRAQ